jgi:hypothetical protein
LKLRAWQRLVLAVCVVVFVVVLYRGHQVAEGRRTFVRLGCPACHIAGGAPSLATVGRKYDRATFVIWLSNPETIYARLGRKPLNAGYPEMPRQAASARDIEMLSYFLAAQR